MLTINPIKLNTSNISFGNENNITPNMAILALQSPNAKREFEGNLDNAMPSNPFATVIKKIARTYKYISTCDMEIYPVVCILLCY